MLGSVQAEEVAQTAGMYDFRVNPRSLFGVIERNNAKLVITATILQHEAANPTGRKQDGRRLDGPERRLCQKQDVIGDVQHALAVNLQIVISLRSPKRS